MPSDRKFGYAQNYFQVILFRELIAGQVPLQNALGSGCPPCKALQNGGAAETNLDLIIPGRQRGLLFHGADGKTKLQIKCESEC